MNDQRRVSESEVSPPPSWIPLLDWSVVTLLILAAFVFLFGGFREYVGMVRISIRSADRIFVLAILLIVVRHTLTRSPAMTTTVGGTIRKAWASEERRAVWPAFVATRLGVIAVGYLAVVTIGFAPGTARFYVSQNALEN